jgi:cytochrome c-type biogenesis protein CcmH/NrfF
LQPLVAAHFLAGSLLTWAMPIGLLILVGLYWWLLLRRRASGTGTGKTE